jgi:hypothetical protein
MLAAYIALILCAGKQIGPRPDRRSHARFHSWRTTDRAMNLSEVIRENKQGNSGLEIVPLTAESVRQARHSAHPHPNGQVRSFNVAGADQFAVRIADQWLHDGPFQFAGRVAGWAFRYSSVNLNQLTIINSRSEAERYSIRIGLHSVCRKLELSQRRFVQLFNKDFRIGAVTSAKVPSENYLAVAFDREECPRIALALVLRVAFVPFFTKAKAPQLIGLYVRHGYFAHMLLQNCLALVASNLEDTEHGRDRNIAQAGRAANATAFTETVENAVQLFIRQVDRPNGFDAARREGLTASAAPISRRSVLAVKAVRLRAVDVTGRTIHRITKSFLTRITVGNTMRLLALLGINGAGQVMSLRGVTSTPSDSRYELVAGIRFGRMKGCSEHPLLGLQPSAFGHSASPPLIQTSSLIYFLGCTRLQKRIALVALFLPKLYRTTLDYFLIPSRCLLTAWPLRRENRFKLTGISRDHFDRGIELIKLWVWPDWTPDVESLSSARLHGSVDLSLSRHTLQRKIYRCHVVLKLLYVKAHRLQAVAHVNSAQRTVSGLHNNADSISQAPLSDIACQLCRVVVPWNLPNHFVNLGDIQKQFSNFVFKFHLPSFSFRVLCHLLSQLGLRHFQMLNQKGLVHGGNLYH